MATAAPTKKRRRADAEPKEAASVEPKEAASAEPKQAAAVVAPAQRSPSKDGVLWFRRYDVGFPPVSYVQHESTFVLWTGNEEPLTWIAKRVEKERFAYTLVAERNVRAILATQRELIFSPERPLDPHKSEAALPLTERRAILRLSETAMTVVPLHQDARGHRALYWRNLGFLWSELIDFSPPRFPPVEQEEAQLRSVLLASLDSLDPRGSGSAIVDHSLVFPRALVDLVLGFLQAGAGDTSFVCWKSSCRRWPTVVWVQLTHCEDAVFQLCSRLAVPSDRLRRYDANVVSAWCAYDRQNMWKVEGPVILDPETAARSRNLVDHLGSSLLKGAVDVWQSNWAVQRLRGRTDFSPVLRG